MSPKYTANRTIYQLSLDFKTGIEDRDQAVRLNYHCRKISDMLSENLYQFMNKEITMEIKTLIS